MDSIDLELINIFKKYNVQIPIINTIPEPIQNNNLQDMVSKYSSTENNSINNCTECAPEPPKQNNNLQDMINKYSSTKNNCTECGPKLIEIYKEINKIKNDINYLYNIKNSIN